MASALEKFPPHLDVPAARVRKAIVPIIIEEAPGEVFVGSGVLVKLGGKEFIFTAGHNVWSSNHRRRNKLYVFMDIGGLWMTAHAEAVEDVIFHAPPSGDPDPDVAVIVPSPKAILAASREPYEENEIDYFDGDVPQTELLLCGFPRDLARVRDDLPKIEKPTSKAAIDFSCITLNVWSIPGRRGKSEPPVGRGIHVFFDLAGTAITDPKGFSGGPLLMPVDRGRVVGLAVSKLDVVLHEETPDGVEKRNGFD